MAEIVLESSIIKGEENSSSEITENNNVLTEIYY